MGADMQRAAPFGVSMAHGWTPSKQNLQLKGLAVTPEQAAQAQGTLGLPSAGTADGHRAQPTCIWILCQSSSVSLRPHFWSSCCRTLRLTARQWSISARSSSMSVW